MTPKPNSTIGGTLSYTSKMPCPSYSIPAQRCITGSKLATVPGSTCFKCYALKGNYNYPNVKNALETRYASLSDPQWVDGMVDAIVNAPDHWTRDGIRTEHDRGFFRWHDSGDLQSVAHLANIVAIATRLPDVKFWLPTREYQIVRDYLREYKSFPLNLIVRLSAHMVDAAPTKLAKQLSLTTSTVTTNHDEPNLCPSQANAKAWSETNGKKRGAFCGDCRRCWDASVANVPYPQH
jgi:hypothetical protein